MLLEKKTLDLEIPITWAEYRSIDRNSYSTISQFQKDRKVYYKKYVLKEKQDDKPNPYFIYGSLVDCLLFTPEEFKHRFYVNTAPEPTPQMAEFTRNLAKRIGQDATAQKRENIRVLMQYAYDDTKYDKKGEDVAFKKQSFEKTVIRFFKECKDYLRSLLSVEMGMDLVSLFDYNRAEYAITSLYKSKATGSILTLKSDDRYLVLKQLVILYEILGMKLKSMLDLVVIDRFERKIYMYDLKTSHNVEEFSLCFVKFNYYIQLGCYTIAMLNWMEQNGYSDYELVPMKFIVVDNNNYMAPLLYESGLSTLASSLLGFPYNGKRYSGVLQLIQDLQWHLKAGIWNTSKNNYLNNGVANIDLTEVESIISEQALALA